MLQHQVTGARCTAYNNTMYALHSLLLIWSARRSGAFAARHNFGGLTHIGAAPRTSSNKIPVQQFITGPSDAHSVKQREEGDSAPWYNVGMEIQRGLENVGKNSPALLVKAATKASSEIGRGLREIGLAIGFGLSCNAVALIVAPVVANDGGLDRLIRVSKLISTVIATVILSAAAFWVVAVKVFQKNPIDCLTWLFKIRSNTTNVTDD